MKYQIWDAVIVREDMFSSSWIDDDGKPVKKNKYMSEYIDIKWDDPHQAMRWMACTIKTAHEIPWKDVWIYTLEEDELNAAWPEDFFVKQSTKTAKATKAARPQNIISMNKWEILIAEEWPTERLLNDMRRRKDQFKGKVSDQDVLRDLFFERLKDKITIMINDHHR